MFEGREAKSKKTPEVGESARRKGVGRHYLSVNVSRVHPLLLERTPGLADKYYSACLTY
jgi:hypothetical protein